METPRAETRVGGSVRQHDSPAPEGIALFQVRF